MTSFYFTSFLDRVLNWSRANSLWYLTTGSGCCANEMLQTWGCRYDFERFGCLPQVDPRQADLLVVCGVVTKKAAPEIRKTYEMMRAPSYVLAVGACACTGGLFDSTQGYSVMRGVEAVVPVDVYVPGCPPRPEAIMNGLIHLQEKIRGS